MIQSLAGGEVLEGAVKGSEYQANEVEVQITLSANQPVSRHSINSN